MLFIPSLGLTPKFGKAKNDENTEIIKKKRYRNHQEKTTEIIKKNATPS